MKYLKTLCLYGLSTMLLISCTPNTTNTPNTPEIPSVLTTSPVSSITQTTATTGGMITSDGGSTITARGVCWSISANPTIAGSKTTDGAGIGTFTSSITGLLPGTTYFVRAYATNSNSTTYGSSYQFTTSNATAATLTTTPVSSISNITVNCGGTITSDGGSTITARGVCWSTTPNPTTSNFKTTDGSGVGSFSSSLTGLVEGTSYYVRAYAINAVGTTYGLEVIFKTIVIDIDGNSYHTVTIGSQTWLVENIKTTKYRNGDLIGTTSPSTQNISSEITPKYQWAYNGDESNVAKYGRLYTWYAVTDSRNIAPTGWHVATDADWTTLQTYVASNYGTSLNTAKALAATTDWSIESSIGSIGNNLSINNYSGFSALPGGYRADTGTFNFIGQFGRWFSYNTTMWILDFSNNSLRSGPTSNRITKSTGYSVRCVRDL